jgi:hypothetical protein
MLRAVSERQCIIGGRGFADYEDGWFCHCFGYLRAITKVPVNLAPHTISKVRVKASVCHSAPLPHPVFSTGQYFSVETHVTEVPMGAHAPGRYYANSLAEFKEFCPEALAVWKQ